jgi:hypothetical protein
MGNILSLSNQHVMVLIKADPVWLQVQLGLDELQSSSRQPSTSMLSNIHCLPMVPLVILVEEWHSINSGSM